jgi:hypothetical protein
LVPVGSGLQIRSTCTKVQVVKVPRDKLLYRTFATQILELHHIYLNPKSWLIQTNKLFGMNGL